jgi:hypothetical protein
VTCCTTRVSLQEGLGVRKECTALEYTWPVALLLLLTAASTSGLGRMGHSGRGQSNLNPILIGRKCTSEDGLLQQQSTCER